MCSSIPMLDNGFMMHGTSSISQQQLDPVVVNVIPKEFVHSLYHSLLDGDIIDTDNISEMSEEGLLEVLTIQWGYKCGCHGPALSVCCLIHLKTEILSNHSETGQNYGIANTNKGEHYNYLLLLDFHQEFNAFLLHVLGQCPTTGHFGLSVLLHEVDEGWLFNLVARDVARYPASW